MSDVADTYGRLRVTYARTRGASEVIDASMFGELPSISDFSLSRFGLAWSVVTRRPTRLPSGSANKRQETVVRVSRTISSKSSSIRIFQ